MDLVTNKEFGNLKIDVYSENNKFYMSRRQINEALEYSDDKSLARIISRNKDIIGEGLKATIPQQEGDRIVNRVIELFNFVQIFHILRFSRSTKADAFMTFTAHTMEQLLSGNASLQFKSEELREQYLHQIKTTLQEYQIHGIKKTTASLMIQEAKMMGENPDDVLLAHLRHQKEIETARLRGRVVNMVNAIHTAFDIDHEDIWHLLAAKMDILYGINVARKRSQSKINNQKDLDEGIRPARPVLAYPDIFEMTESYPEAIKCLKKIGREIEKEYSERTETTKLPL
jgi:hypothetical protein